MELILLEGKDIVGLTCFLGEIELTSYSVTVMVMILDFTTLEWRPLETCSDIWTAQR